MMNHYPYQETFSSLTLELYQPNPDTLYNLDAVAHITGVSRRSILIYCRAGLIQPRFQYPLGIMEFTEEMIYIIRKVETLRVTQGLDLPSLKLIFDLFAEVNRLRSEIRFLRNI